MYQSIVLVGNLGRDPEQRFTPSGQAVTNFSVATNHQYTDSNGQQVKETTWFRVTTWGKQAETCYQYLKKGRTVLVEGRLTSDPATGGPKVYKRQDGSSGASFEITARTVRFLPGRGDAESGYQAAGETSQGAEDPGDIPF